MNRLQYLIDKIQEAQTIGKHVITFEELKSWFREKSIRTAEQPSLTAHLRQWIKDNNIPILLRFSHHYDQGAIAPIDASHQYYHVISNLYPEFSYLESTYNVVDIMEKAIDEAYKSLDSNAPWEIHDWAWWYISQAFYRKLSKKKTKDEIDDIFTSMPEADATETKSGTALTIFMKQMGRYPLLKPEEEKQLAQIIYRYRTELKKKELQEKLQRGISLSDEEIKFLKTHSPLTVDEDLIKTLEPQAKQAIDRFITANLRLVVSIAKHYASNQIPLEDLIEEGVLGLMKAIEDFNPNLGYKFSTYATWWIRQHVERYIANTKSQVRVPVHMQENIKKYEKTYENLLATLGRLPSDEEIARQMGLSTDKVQKIKQIMKYQYVYIDSARDITPYEVPDTHPWASPEEYVMKKDMERHILNILSKLPERNRDILMMYFGIGGYSPMSLTKIGEIYGLSRERVRQIINSSLKKLRHKAYLQKLRKVAPFYSHVSSPNPQQHTRVRYRPVFKPEKHPVYTEVHRLIRHRKYFLLNRSPKKTSHQLKEASSSQAHTSTTFKIVIPTRRIRQSIFHMLKKLRGQ